MEILKQGFNIAGYALEAFGVLTILAGCLLAGAGFLREWRHLGAEEAYRALRRRLGQAIILGLEFLIAGDIIQTVVVTQTLESAAVLAVIVLIRAFLSFTLEHTASRGAGPGRARPRTSRLIDGKRKNLTGITVYTRSPRPCGPRDDVIAYMDAPFLPSFLEWWPER